MCGLVAVIAGSGALLVPSYLYLQEEIQSRELKVATLDASLASSEGREANARLTALVQNSSYLARLATTSTATASIRSVLALPRSGITLSGFSYSPPARTGVDGRLIIDGVASTREALRTYVQVLGKIPSVTNVDLPISVYAKENDIPFTVSLVGSLTP